jgi:hypothetical protein
MIYGHSLFNCTVARVDRRWPGVRPGAAAVAALGALLCGYFCGDAVAAPGGAVSAADIAVVGRTPDQVLAHFHANIMADIRTEGVRVVFSYLNDQQLAMLCGLENDQAVTQSMSASDTVKAAAAHYPVIAARYRYVCPMGREAESALDRDPYARAEKALLAGAIEFTAGVNGRHAVDRAGTLNPITAIAVAQQGWEIGKSVGGFIYDELMPDSVQAGLGNAEGGPYSPMEPVDSFAPQDGLNAYDASSTNVTDGDGVCDKFGGDHKC